MKTEAGISYRTWVNSADWSVWLELQAAPASDWPDSMSQAFDELLRDVAARKVDAWCGIHTTTVVWRCAVSAETVSASAEKIALALVQCQCVVELERRQAVQELDLEPLDPEPLELDV